MNARTATEQDVRNERSDAYLDGADMGMSHMFDALASGHDMETAMAYAKEMVRSAAEAMKNGTIGRSGREEIRKAIRAKWKVELLGHMGNVGHKKLA